MQQILASRGMGKTMSLLNKASRMAETNREKKVVFLSPNSVSFSIQEKYPRLWFMTFRDFIYNIPETLRKQYDAIYIDELDYCVASLINTHTFSYSLNIGDLSI